MKYNVIYNKKDGEILHLYSVFDAGAGAFVSQKKEEILSALSDYVKEPQEVDIIAVREALDLHEMRVNTVAKKLERFPPEKEGRV